MKRFIYLAAVASIALVGCAKNEATVVEGNSDQLISFASPVVGLATKATMVGYPTTAPSFHVLGLLHTGTYKGWTSSGSYEIGTYMNTEVVYSDLGAATDAWVPSPKVYYWPKNETEYKLSFIAYSPNSATSASIDAAGVKFTNHEVLSTNPNVDLLYSLMTYNQIKTKSSGVNDGSPEYPAVAPEYQGVNLHFKHALSSINFKVKTEGTYETTEIKLTGITLTKVKRVGNFVQNLKTGESELGSGPIDAHEGTPAWSGINTDDENYTVTLSTSLTALSTTAQDAGAELILLPQDLTDAAIPDTQYATINYTMQSKVAGSLSGPEVPCSATVRFYGNTGGNKWEIGKKYIYTIIIGLDEIYFAPEVIDWEEGSTGTGIAI